MAVYRYVDDYFAPERPDSMKHAMLCFARLVRVLLGVSAIADKKLACGLSLGILGVDIALSAHGFTCRPSKDKVGLFEPKFCIFDFFLLQGTEMHKSHGRGIESRKTHGW